MNRPLVIYHGNCQDGFTAAWVMRQWLAQFGETYADAEFFPAHYAARGERVQLPDVTGREVWMVDFCTGREQLLEMQGAADRLVVLDHHKTAQAACDGLDFCMFDMGRSGAMLAWDWCFPKRNAPWLVYYVQDRDLWRFALPLSREVNAFLQSEELTFEGWDRASATPLGVVNERGRGALAYIDRYVREMKQQARRVTFAGYPDIPMVNAPYISTSELVGALAEDALFAVGWFERSDGQYQYSLRSRGDFDVSALAKQFGGGGHKNAAGFSAPTRVEVGA